MLTWAKTRLNLSDIQNEILFSFVKHNQCTVNTALLLHIFSILRTIKRNFERTLYLPSVSNSKISRTCRLSMGNKMLLCLRSFEYTRINFSQVFIDCNAIIFCKSISYALAHLAIKLKVDRYRLLWNELCDKLQNFYVLNTNWI